MQAILISQPAPKEKSPYIELSKKFDLTVDFCPFVQMEAVSSQDFRQKNLDLSTFNAVVFSSKSAIDHYFRICEDMRYVPKEETRFFCPSESVSLYIQKYTMYRKRRVFFGKQSLLDLADTFKKNKDKKFFIPTSEVPLTDLYQLLNKQNCKYEAAVLYQTMPLPLQDLPLEKYSIITFFSSTNVQAFAKSFKKIPHKKIKIACFGEATKKECEKLGWEVAIFAPTPQNPSMIMAISNFLEKELVVK